MHPISFTNLQESFQKVALNCALVDVKNMDKLIELCPQIFEDYRNFLENFSYADKELKIWKGRVQAFHLSNPLFRILNSIKIICEKKNITINKANFFRWSQHLQLAILEHFKNLSIDYIQSTIHLPPSYEGHLHFKFFKILDRYLEAGIFEVCFTNLEEIQLFKNFVKGFLKIEHADLNQSINKTISDFILKDMTVELLESHAFFYLKWSLYLPKSDLANKTKEIFLTQWKITLNFENKTFHFSFVDYPPNFEDPKIPCADLLKKSGFTTIELKPVHLFDFSQEKSNKVAFFWVRAIENRFKVQFSEVVNLDNRLAEIMFKLNPLVHLIPNCDTTIIPTNNSNYLIDNSEKIISNKLFRDEELASCLETLEKGENLHDSWLKIKCLEYLCSYYNQNHALLSKIFKQLLEDDLDIKEWKLLMSVVQQNRENFEYAFTSIKILDQDHRSEITRHVEILQPLWLKHSKFMEDVLVKFYKVSLTPELRLPYQSFSLINAVALQRIPIESFENVEELKRLRKTLKLSKKSFPLHISPDLNYA